MMIILIKLIAALAILSHQLAAAQEGSCRVAAICGEGFEFNEITLNFTELSGNSGNLAQVTDQLQNQFQSTLDAIQDQLALLQTQQAKINECSSQTYSNFVQASDYVKYRGYMPKLTEWQVCGWINYNDNGNSQTLLSYFIPGAGEFYWEIRSSTDTFVNVPGHSIEFMSHPSIEGNHFICVSHDGNQSVSLSIDGSTTVHHLDVAQPLSIPEGGSLVLGQRQSEGVEQPFGSGSISNLMVWSRVLTNDEVTQIANSCVCPKDFVVSFPHSQVERHGDVQFAIPDHCPRLAPAATVDSATSNQA